VYFMLARRLLRLQSYQYIQILFHATETNSEVLKHNGFSLSVDNRFVLHLRLPLYYFNIFSVLKIEGIK
jgi:hypothetical protein